MSYFFFSFVRSSSSDRIEFVQDKWCRWESTKTLICSPCEFWSIFHKFGDEFPSNNHGNTLWGFFAFCFSCIYLFSMEMVNDFGGGWYWDMSTSSTSSTWDMPPMIYTCINAFCVNARFDLAKVTNEILVWNFHWLCQFVCGIAWSE